MKKKKKQTRKSEKVTETKNKKREEEKKKNIDRAWRSDVLMEYKTKPKTMLLTVLSLPFDA